MKLKNIEFYFITALFYGNTWASGADDYAELLNQDVLPGSWVLYGRYIAYVLIVVALFVVFRVFKGLGRTQVSGKTLALTSIHIDTASRNGEFLVFKGRVVGIMAWVLTRLGLDTEYKLTATAKGVSLRETNLIGRNKTFLPGSMISEVYCAYSRDVNWLRYTIVLVALSVYFSSIKFSLLFLALACLCAYLFYASKKLLIYIATPSSWVWIRFSEGFFEGVDINYEKLSQVSKELGMRYHEIQTGTYNAGKIAKA